MRVNLAILADYANITREGKLNILGIFSVLTAQSFPCIHPQMQVVVEWAADPEDSGTVKNVGIQLQDEDGKQLFNINGNITLAPFIGYGPVRLPQIFGINGLMFNKPGDYAFKVLLENKPIYTIQLLVNQLSETKQF